MYAKKLEQTKKMCSEITGNSDLAESSFKGFDQPAKPPIELSKQLQSAIETSRYDSIFKVFESTTSHTYTWAIEDYPMRKIFDDNLSVQFSFPTSKWSLSIKDQDIILKNLEDQPNCFAFGEITVSGPAGIQHCLFSHNFKKHSSFSTKVPELCNDSFLPSDTLTITCSLNDVRTLVKGTERLRKICPSMFLAPLFEIPIFYDIEFLVRYAKFQGHKAMFRLRCPKFWEAVTNFLPRDEVGMDCVSITHISPQVFRAFLLYIYTDKVVLDSTTIQLLLVADEYGITALKTKCEKILPDSLNLSNAINYFTSAQTANAQQLLDKATRLICSNLNVFPPEEIRTKFLPHVKKLDDSFAMTPLLPKPFKTVQKTFRWDFFVGTKLTRVNSEVKVENVSLMFSYETDDLGNVLLKVEPKTEGRIVLNLELAVTEERRQDEAEMCFYKKSSRSFGPGSPANFHFEKIVQGLLEVKRNFTVLCHVVVYRTVEVQENFRSNDCECDPSHGLCNDLRQLYETNLASDLLLLTQKRTLKAHKFILGPNMKIISDLIENSWQEMRPVHAIEARQMPYDVVNGIVEFFYTGEVANLEAVDDRFLEACYNLDVNPKLKDVCQEMLGMKIDLGNIMKMINVAVKNKADFLMGRCLNFMRMNDIAMADLINANPTDVSQKNVFMEENIFKVEVYINISNLLQIFVFVTSNLLIE